MKHQGVLERPKIRAQVLTWTSEDKSSVEIAALVSAIVKHPVSFQAVCAFRKRHEAELAALALKVEQAVTDYTIAQKVNRIAAYDADWRGLGAVIEARKADERYDEPGYSTGMMVHSLKMLGSGENATVVDEYRVDTALVAERRALARAAAEELGQIERPPIVSITNDNRKYVLTWDDGTEA